MKRILAVAALLCAVTVTFGQGTSTNTATWKWTAPTTYVDGSPIASGTAITYNLYTGLGKGGESATATQTGLTVLAASTVGYADGATVCGELTAVVNGIESTKSVEACKTFPLVAPAAPTLTVQ